MCDAHALILKNVNESQFHKKSISFLPKFKFGRRNILVSIKDFEKSLNEVACQTETTEKIQKTTQIEDPAKIKKLANYYARNGWMNKLIAPSCKKIRKKKFPDFCGQILSGGFSLTPRPARKLFNTSTPPALSTKYLQKSIEVIDRTIFKTETNLRILLDEQREEKRLISVMKTSMLDLEIRIDIFYNFLQKKFKDSNVINLSDLKITVSNNARNVEETIPATDNTTFKIPEVPKKRRAASTTNIPQLGQRTHTPRSNIAKKPRREGDQEAASTSHQTQLVSREGGNCN